MARIKLSSMPNGFGTAYPTFGPAARLDLDNADLTLSAERGERSGQEKKYGNRIVHLDGYTFQSKKEANEYAALKVEQAAGRIRELRVHPTFDLRGLDGSIVYEYTADFAFMVFIPSGGFVQTVIDCKSVATRKKDTWRVVRKLFRATYGFDITER